MRKISFILLIIGLLFTSVLIAQPTLRGDTTDCADLLDLAWVKTAGDIDDDNTNGVCVDNDGNIIIVGYFRGNMTFQTQAVSSTGAADYFVAKLDPDGNLIWIRTGGGPQDDFAVGVATDANNNINILGIYRGTATIGNDEVTSTGGKDIFIAQYTTFGDYNWGQFAGGFNDDSAGKIAVDNNNNILITGTYNFAIGIGSGSVIAIGGDDFFVAKFNEFGSFIWCSNNGSVSNDSGTDIACDNSGNVFVTGEFAGILQFGSTTLTASGAKDVFLTKYNSSGGFIWAKKVGTNGDNDKAGGVSVDLYGNSYIFYKSDQITNMAKIEKYNSTGALQFSSEFGGSGTIFPKSITVDFSENIYVSGMYSGITNFGDGDVNVVGGSDYFIAKFNSDGSFKFKDIAGSIFIDCANEICLDNDNNIIVVGSCTNGIYFGTTPYTAVGKDDILLVKYDRYFSFGEITFSSINCDPNNICVDITVLGGTPPFDYYWSDGQTEEDVCGFSPGSYQIIVTDENDCYIATDITVSAPQGPNISLPASYNLCPNDTITINAGAGNFGYVWNTTETTQTIDISNDGSYSVTVTDFGTGCTGEASTLVVSYPNINLLDETIYTCIDEEITLSVSGFSQYLWSNGSTQPNFTTDEDGYHWLRVYNGTCYYYDTILVINFPKPQLDLGNDVLMCSGDSVEVFAQSGYVSYLWQDNSTGLSFWAFEAGIVSVIITDVNDCEATDNLTVTTMEKPDIELGDDATYCINTPIILDPNDPSDENTYLWSTGSTQETITVINSGYYWVQASNEAGCTSSDTINLIIFPQPIVYLGQDIDFCEGGESTLTAGTNYISWLWNTGSTANSIIATETGIYSVTVVDENLCTDTDSIIVTEHFIPFPFIGYDTVLCVGENHILQTEYNYMHYLWNNGSHASTLSVSQAGTYSLTVSDNIGCSATATLNILFQTGPTIVSATAGGGHITVNATGGTAPLIYSHDGDTWQQSNTIQHLESNTYTIWVMDANYCISTIDVFLDQSIDIPSYFTPNGDGYNDYWVISGLYHYPEAIVQIFDRFGKKLYEFSGSEFGWDGNYMGLMLPSDTYWYAIKLTENLDPLTGSVTIIR